VLTISEVARYAGVTVRAVRHYHAKGLLPEPERDYSGYRRYDANAVIDLIKIRTLAEAGVPLTRVRELMHADDAQFASAVAEIDRRLQDEIRQRERRRDSIARLAAGDHLTLPIQVVDYLEHLRALGIDERIVRAERDGWIVLAAQAPEQVPAWMARKQQQIADRQLINFYKILSQALDQTEDDPRLAELADELAAYFTHLASEHGEPYLNDTNLDRALADLMDTLALDTIPPARRLLALLRERGWTGWTELERASTRRPV
jgi:DNA-binding transcriptional MerR regulator